MILENELKLFAVRIESKIGDKQKYIGSGVLWKPQESEYVYILTAGHVINPYLNNDHEIIISYMNTEEEVISESINKEDIWIHDCYEEYGGEKPPINDAAILRSKNINCVNLEYNITLLRDKPESNELIFNGFPYGKEDDDFEEHITLFKGTYIDSMKQKSICKYRLDISNAVDATCRNDELRGISGAGIFLNDDKIMHLIGVHTSGFGKEVNFNDVRAIGMNHFIEICKSKSLDIPKISSNINGNFENYKSKVLEIIKNEEIIEEMVPIINSDLSEIIKKKFCDKSDKCDSKERYHRCDTFRYNLLIVITLIKFFNKDVDIDNLIDKIDSMKLKFICNDGLNGDYPPIKITNFIQSLNEKYLDKGNIKNNIQEESLIIWSSKDTITGKKQILEDEYERNLKDIYSKNPEYNFDILYGKRRPKKLRIIYMEEIIEYINLNKLDELKKYMKFK